MRLFGALLAAVLALLLAGCAAANPETIGPTGVDGLVVPTPTPDPDDFVDGVDNPLLPLTVGSRWTYRASGPDGESRVEVTVTDEGGAVAGVPTTVVRSTVTRGGETVAEREQAYAQDRAGNVWLLAETTTTYDGARDVVAWEAGVDGVGAGLAMPAEPRVGDSFTRVPSPEAGTEVLEVLSVTGEELVLALDAEGLPDVVHTETYEPGTGLVLREESPGEGRLELVSHEPG